MKATPIDDPLLRERASAATQFDAREVRSGAQSIEEPPIFLAALPLFVVVALNLSMSLLVLPRLDFSYLALPEWGGIQLSAVSGVWSVMLALAGGTLVVILANRSRLTTLRESMDAGANASVLPIMSVASLVGFGSVVAALPAFAMVRDWVLSVQGGPLVSLAFATNVLAALTGSASGGLTIALDALGPTYVKLAAEHGIDLALMHRVAVIGSGTLDSLPHNGAVVTLLAVCGCTHRSSYFDLVISGIVGPILALVVVIALGSVAGSF
jgi:H+/gluconate symporter-like permease